MSVAPAVEQAANDLPELELVSPMPGFPDSRRFVLVRLDEAGALYELRSLDADDLRFVVIAPAPFFPDYAPELDDGTVVALDLVSAEDALVLLVVTTGGADGPSANLLAPIVINTRNRRAIQAVLSASDLPLRAPLTRR